MFGISKVNLKIYSTKIYTNLKFMPWIIYAIHKLSVNVRRASSIMEPFSSSWQYLKAHHYKINAECTQKAPHTLHYNNLNIIVVRANVKCEVSISFFPHFCIRASKATLINRQKWLKSKIWRKIACGSATSWMVDKVFHNKGGLFNRVTRHLYLRPFTLHEKEVISSS